MAGRKRRNASRTGKYFEASALVDVIRKLSALLHSQLAGDPRWLVIDSSDLTVEQTVDRILKVPDEPQRSSPPQ